jgi:hypothetical protein
MQFCRKINSKKVKELKIEMALKRGYYRSLSREKAVRFVGNYRRCAGKKRLCIVMEKVGESLIFEPTILTDVNLL